jgi:hypothetical protein
MRMNERVIEKSKYDLNGDNHVMTSAETPLRSYLLFSITLSFILIPILVP